MRKTSSTTSLLGIYFFIATFVITFAVIIGTLFWLGRTQEPVAKPEMAVCMIIIPHGKLAEGWKFRDPSENGNISNLLRDGKAEIDNLPGLVECTVSGHNQTPVTTSSALAMWRRK